MSNRIINFFDQAASSTSPTVGNISASDLVKYPDDATFEASETGAPIGGNIYYNTTDDVVRYYDDSIPGWVTVLTDQVIDSTFLISDDGDVTKKVRFEVSGVSPATIRVLAIPDEDTTIAGTDATQTLTNKTIDANNNTISNLEHGNEVNNPSSGVHGVTGNVVGTTDTQTLTNKTIGDDLSIQGTTTSTTPTTGALTVAGGVGINENLNVQGNVEIQGDLTVQGTTVTLNTATLDVEDTNITVNKNGNDATSEGAGLTVERTGTDGSLVYEDALASKWKAGALGAEEEVVTTDHQQRIINKDIDLGTATDNNGLTVSKQTTANLEALTREEGRVYYSTDDQSYYGDDGTDLIPIGSGDGGGGLNFYEKGDAERANTGDFSTGNNATFLGGGTLAGTFSISTTAADLIRGKKTFKYVQSATAGDNDDDYIASPLISIPQGYRGRSQLAKFQYRTDATSGNIKVVVWDETNSVQLNSVTDTVDTFDDSVDNTAQEYQVIFTVPADCLEVRFGFQVITGEANSYLLWDDVSIGPDLGATINNLIDPLFVKGAGNSGGTLTADVTNITFTEVTDTHGAWNGTVFTAPISANYVFAGSVFFTTAAARRIDYYVNDSTNYTCGLQEGSVTTCAFAGSHYLNAGDTLSFRSGQAGTLSNDAVNHNISIVAELDSTHVITPARSNMTDWVQYTPTFTAFGTVTVHEFFWRRVGSTLHIQGTFTSGSGTAAEARISFPSGLTASNDFTVIRNAGLYFRGAASSDKGGNVMYEPNLGYMVFSDNGVFNSDTVNSTSKANGNNIGSAGNTMQVSGMFEISGWSSDAVFLAAIPVEKTVYLKDVKASGTDGGTFTSGAWQTRTLNTIEGDSAIVRLLSNQFLLQPGTYQIEASAPAYRVAEHQLKIRNITNSQDSILGQVAYCGDTASNGAPSALLSGPLTITTPTIFELQHRCTTTVATNGFGRGVSFGINTTFAQVKISKVK